MGTKGIIWKQVYTTEGFFFLDLLHANSASYQRRTRVKFSLAQKEQYLSLEEENGKVRGDGVLSSSLEKRVFQWTHLHGDDSTRESLRLSFTAASRFLDPRRNGLPKYQSLKRPSTKLYSS